jgi:hypothetical protein
MLLMVAAAAAVAVWMLLLCQHCGQLAPLMLWRL